MERSGYQPQQDKYNGGTENYLTLIRHFKDQYSIPIIASMNGASVGSWLDYAKEIQAAGADALELNWQSGVSAPDEPASQVEAKLCDCVANVREMVSIPISIKLTQHFTNLANVAHKLKEV